MLNNKFDNKKNKKTFRPAKFIQKYGVALIVIILIISGVVASIKIVYDRREDEKKNPGTETWEDTDALYLAMYTPKSFNVYKSSDEDVVYLNQVIYSSLFVLDDTLNIAPDLVDTYTTDPDAGSVSINLRKDALFSDESALTSYDVKFSVEAIKDAGKESPYFRDVSLISDVIVEDENNFTIEFNSPTDAALDHLLFPIVSSSDYSSDKEYIVGSGPYTYGTYKKGKALDLNPNKSYFGKVPTKPVHITMVKDKSNIPGLMSMNAVTAALIKDTAADSIARDHSFQIKKIPSGNLEYLGFNHKKELMKNPDFRRAIAQSIRISDIIKDDYSGNAVKSDSIYYPGFLGADEKDSLKYNSKQALEDFKKAGLLDDTGDGKLKYKDDTISLTIIVSDRFKSRIEAAESIGSDLEKIGLSISVKVLSSEEYNKSLKAGNFDMYLGGLSINKQFQLTELFSESNVSGYNDKDVMDKVKALESCRTAEELSGLFSVLKESLNREVPYYPICYRDYNFMAVAGFESTTKPMYFSPYRGIEEWNWKRRVISSEKDEKKN